MHVRPVVRRAVRPIGVLTGMLGFALTLAVSGGLTQPAYAHTELVGTEPKANATVTSAPTEVRLNFSGPVQASFIVLRVTGPDGAAIGNGSARIAGKSVVQPLRALTVPGKYQVVARVVAADGHPVSKQLTFTYAPPAGGATGQPGATPPPAGPTATTSATPTAPNQVAQQPPSKPVAAEGTLARHRLHLIVLGLVVVTGGLLLWRERRRAT